MTDGFKALLLFIAGVFIFVGCLKTFWDIFTGKVDRPKKGESVILYFLSVLIGMSIFHDSNFWKKVGSVLWFIVKLPYCFFNWVYRLFARVKETPKWMAVLSGISTALIWFSTVSAWLFL